MTQSPIAASSQKPQQPISKPSNSDYNKGAESSTSAFSNQSQHRNQLVLLTGGVQFFEALQNAFQQAQHYIALETYIFDFEGSSALVAQALIDASLRGVQVHVLVDGVGTPHIPTAWLNKLSQAGVLWVHYLPLGTVGLLFPSRWRRLHRKLCVIDGKIAFCGGINILDDFFDPNYGSLEFARWDFALQVTGPLVQTIDDTMKVLWYRNWAKQLAQTKTLLGVKSAWQHISAANSLALTQHQPEKKSLERRLLRDNIKNKRNIERAYLSAFASEQQEILIANDYFLPGKKVSMALLKAVKRGLRVRVLLQGRYEYFMQFHASRAVYLDLLMGGVEIYEYQASFLHAKVAVVDPLQKKSWCTVGSSNLDPLSLLLAREANIEVFHHEMAVQIANEIEIAIAKSSQQVLLEQFQKRNFTQRLLNWTAYGLMRFALFITGKRY